MIQSAEAYVRERFANLAVAADPFPHFILQDVLPPALYAEMEKSLPPQWRWRLSSLVGACKRLQSIQPHFAVRQPDRSADFGLASYRDQWLNSFGDVIEMIDWFTIHAFAPFIDAYRSRLDRSGIKLSKGVTPGQAIFCQRSDDWQIPPHTHSLAQVIQSMIYFPVQGSNEKQGTVLYRIKHSQRAPAREFEATRSFDRDSIEPASTLPYQPNCLVSFMNTPEAVHSSPNRTPRSTGRRYIFSCMQAQIELGNGDIAFGPDQGVTRTTHSAISVG